MKICVLAFARLREVIGASERSLDLPENARIEDAWEALLRNYPALRDERRSTRVARNGKLASFDEALGEGDELALLPPVGGG